MFWEHIVCIYRRDDHINLREVIRWVIRSSSAILRLRVIGGGIPPTPRFFPKLI